MVEYTKLQTCRTHTSGERETLIIDTTGDLSQVERLRLMNKCMQTKPRIGLFSGGIETYWKDTRMTALPDLITRDCRRLKELLEDSCDVVFPGIAGNRDEARRIGETIRESRVDMTLMYHASYIDDDMTLAFLDETQGIFPTLLLSQGMKGIPADYEMVEAGTCWGVNSAVQIHGTLRRVRPALRYGFVFGELGSDRVIKEIGEYARAARAVRNLRGKKVVYLPHPTVFCPMYDTYPDDSMMHGQVGVHMSYLSAEHVVDAMKAVSEEAAEGLCNELYEMCDVIEPPREEVFLAAKQALALQAVVEENQVDALAIDMFPEIVDRCGMIPCVGMARLIDMGYVVATEGDLGAAVSGLLLKDLCGKLVRFWENLGFDEDRNWVFGGDEGGAAGCTMARQGHKHKLRCTQYVNFANVPGAPFNGVLPEFIADPGRVTLLTLFRGKEGYEMRMATGESVDADPRPAHFEHMIFHPDVALRDYFSRIREVGTCHHFAVVHADVSAEVKKAAEILGMKLEMLT